MHPVHDLANNVVYSADGRDILLTMADGRVLYRNGEFLTIDVEKTIACAEREMNAILKQL